MLPSGPATARPVSAYRLIALVCVLGLAPTAAAERAPAPDPYPTAHADTLRYQVRAGETLIVALPGRVGGADVSYEVVEAPALSWLVDRSFMWRTLPQERGLLPVRLRRTAQGSAPEEVVLLVEITA